MQLNQANLYVNKKKFKKMNEKFTDDVNDTIIQIKCKSD